MKTGQVEEQTDGRKRRMGLRDEGEEGGQGQRRKSREEEDLEEGEAAEVCESNTGN